MANAEASPFVLGIAGATGSGKSTLAYGLQDMAPDKVAVLHLDDYFIHEEQMPELAGYRNRDDPA
jgi:uridine kinase